MIKHIVRFGLLLLEDFGSIADTVYINQQKSNLWFHMIASGGTDHTQQKTLPLSTSDFFS